MRRVSLNARRAAEASASGAVEVVLMRFAGGDLDEPVRLSTDPTLRLSVDPLIYGTRSRWQGVDALGRGEDYLFIIASAILPDDQEDQPLTATFVLELLDDEMVTPLRAFVRREISVDIAVVLAATPDVIEAEWRGLSLLMAEADTGQITLSIGREDDDGEPHSAWRMTRDIAPCLHR